jgi:hypothetical protein
MARNIMDTPILSVRPYDLAGMLTGVMPVFPLVGLSPGMIKYRGQIVFHCLPALDPGDNPTLRKLNDTLALMVEENELPLAFNSFMGYGVVKNVYKYDEKRWKKEEKLHYNEESLAVWLAEQTGLMNVDVWGMAFKEIRYIDPPVVNVFPPSDEVGHGSIWYGNNPMHWEGIKMVLRAPEFSEVVPKDL